MILIIIIYMIILVFLYNYNCKLENFINKNRFSYGDESCIIACRNKDGILNRNCLVHCIENSVFY